MAWGVEPIVCDLGRDVDAAIDAIEARLVGSGAIPPSSVVVIVSISPDLSHGPSNFLKLQQV